MYLKNKKVRINNTLLHMPLNEWISEFRFQISSGKPSYGEAYFPANVVFTNN